MAERQTFTNKWGTAKWIVDATAAVGTHTTIATALTSASSGDTIFIRPGSYTENLTLKAGVNLVSYECDSTTPNVTIIGTLTLTAAGTVSISGIRLQTNSAALLAITGSAASIVILNECYLNCTNNTGITFSSSSSSAKIQINNCQGDLGTTGIGLFAHSSAGNLRFLNTLISNSGGSSTASTQSAGSLTLLNSYLSNPVTMSSTASLLTGKFSEIDCSATNSTCLTTVSGSTNELEFVRLASGTATPLSVGGTLSVSNLILHHGNSTAITGAGTLVYSGIWQDSTVGTISVTTITPKGGPVGTIGNTAPAAGYIGEVLSASNTTGTGALVSTTITNITSVTLTPGIWDVTGNANILPTGANTSTYVVAAVATVNNSTTPADNFGSGIGMLQAQITGAPVTVSTGTNLLMGPGRINVSTNTTYFLNCALTASVINAKGYGVIRAVRVG